MKLETEYISSNNFFVLHSCTSKSANKWIEKKYKIKSWLDEMSMWMTYHLENNDKVAIVMWINNIKYKKPSQIIETVFHECWHSVFIQMKRVWIDPLDSTWEHFLYMQWYLVQKIFKDINTHELWQKKKKRKILKKLKKKLKK